MNWLEMLDQMKESLGLRSDAAMARRLGVTPQYLSDVRRGAKQPSAMLKFRILDKMDFAWTDDTVLELLPEELRDLVEAKVQAARGARGSIQSGRPRSGPKATPQGLGGGG